MNFKAINIMDPVPAQDGHAGTARRVKLSENDKVGCKSLSSVSLLAEDHRD